MRQIDNMTPQEIDTLALKGMTAPRTASERPAPNKAQHSDLVGSPHESPGTTGRQAAHSPLPWSVQNGAIYDASDNGRMMNVRLCKLVVSSTAIETADAALIVRAVNTYAEALLMAEALRTIRNRVTNEYSPDYQTANEALIKWEKANQ